MSPTPTYPPAPTATAPANPAPVVQQPGANTGMSVSREAQNQEQKAERLRGGCIPLPVSLRDLLNNSDAEQILERRSLLDHSHSMLLLGACRVIHIRRYFTTHDARDFDGPIHVVLLQ